MCSFPSDVCWLSKLLLELQNLSNHLELLCVLGVRRHTGAEAREAPDGFAVSVASEEESFVLVNAPDSKEQPMPAEVFATPPPGKLSVRQTFQAALVVRLLAPAPAQDPQAPCCSTDWRA